MRFTLSWLKKFLDTNKTLEQIAYTLTNTGLEVEDIDDKTADLACFTVAEIIEAAPHPDADKLKICKVQTGEGIKQIVCGAPNARAGIKVVLARPDTIIPNGGLKIKKSAIRGVESEGMLCSARELNIGLDSDGIIELPAEAVIGKSFISYLGLDDPVIHINITPNRADSLGVYGIAKDLAASDIGTLKPLAITKVKSSFTSEKTLTVNDQDACPLFAIRHIRNISNKGESPLWLRNLLDSIGIGSISPVVDVTNYICYSFGQPMHAYDSKKINGGLTVELLKDNKKFTTLNDKEYELCQGDLVIRDNRQIHCLAGIIGGKESACDQETNEIILEAAIFTPDKVSSTGRRLMIDTDSRYRFERNVNQELTMQALDIATDMILTICGGEASEAKYIGSTKLPVRTIDFPVNFFTSYTGLELSIDDICGILEKLGFTCTISGKAIKIVVPPGRYDIRVKEDIVEEIARIYGYDKIPEIPLPGTDLLRSIPKEQRRVSDIKRILAINGYTEVVSWSFMDSKEAEFFDEIKEELYLQNPISSDLDYMRPSILPNLLKMCRSNMNRSFKDLSLFEVGPIFISSSDETGIISAAGIRTGATSTKNAYEPVRNYDVFDIKADLALLLEHNGLPIDRCQFDSKSKKYYHPTRSATILLGKNVLGYFGQLHPSVLKKFDIETEIMAFELIVSALPISKDKFGRKTDFTASDYQMITRDYAFVIKQDQKIGEMLSYIKNIDKKLIRRVDLFDIYQGDKIEAGKKSIALSVQIQDDNKTLTEDEIEKVHKSIIDGMNQKFDAKIRNC